jgi:NodT family efflux transporter outer membrane factor (OMF) lipoprotein
MVAMAAALVGLTGCASGPDYVKPALDLPVTWKLEAPWRVAQPDDAAAKGPWWQRFGDAQLSALQEQALANNPTLTLAGSRLAQARASLVAGSAALLPQVGLSERANRLRISPNRPLSNYNTANFTTLQNDFVLQGTVSYEVDLAGRVARTVESGRAAVAQSAADLENTRLVLTADLASAYFNLRATDIELDVLGRSIELQRRALALVHARSEGGIGTGLEVAQQQALLDGTLVQVDVLRRQRGVFEHAIATLVGVPAPQFALAVDLRSLQPPAVPLGVPSDVLERRPDIAAAERAMAVANAQIGIARAAFYPSISLGGAFGTESRGLSALLAAPSLLWSAGLSAAQLLFDGGRVQANVDFASAGHAGAVANYRRVVLAAMQEVEDGITGLAALDSAAAQAATAVASARKVLQLASARYEGGASTYAEVITAQQALLASERQATQLQAQRLLTTVFLVKALGGDWSAPKG